MMLSKNLLLKAFEFFLSCFGDEEMVCIAMNEFGIACKMFELLELTFSANSTHSVIYHNTVSQIYQLSYSYIVLYTSVYQL